MTKKNILLILIILTAIQSINAQRIGFKNNVIYNIDLEKGDFTFNTKLKDPVSSFKKSDLGEFIYVQTKHYAYTLNSINGEILNEYQYQEVLVKRENDGIDPNRWLMPLGISSNGIGLFTEKNREKRKIMNTIKASDSDIDELKKLEMATSKLNVRTIQMFDLNTNTTKDVFTYSFLEYDQYPSIIGNRFSFEKRLDYNTIIFETFNLKTGEKLKEYNIDISEETLEVVINKDSYILWYPVSEDVIQFIVTSKNYLVDKNKIRFEYSLIDSKYTKIVKIESIGVHVNNCNFNYTSRKDCEEKEEIPYPEHIGVFIPENHSKKAQAEAKQINDKRAIEYTKAHKEYLKSLTTPPKCIYRLYKMNNGIEDLIIELENVHAVELIDDKYILYTNEFNEFIKFDFINDKIVWSLDL